MPSNPPHRSVLARLLLALGIAGLAFYGLWQLTRDDVAPTVQTAPRATDSGPVGEAPQRAGSPGPTGPADTDVTVLVSTCPGVALEDLIVVIQGAAKAWQAPVVATDGQGSARVPIGQDGGPQSVSVRWRDWTSEPAALPEDGARLVVCPGAEIYGRVMTGQAEPRDGVAVELHDRQGQVVAGAVTNDRGEYSLKDPALTGASVVVPRLEAPEVGRRLIVPLKPLERREMHVLVGGTRPVVGWVLDSRGDPQAGVLVTLDWEQVKSSGVPAKWTATTDGGGAFAFNDAPPGPTRVRADGGVLGYASARVNAASGPGGRPRREVTLVLAPSASLRVTMPMAPTGAVVVVRSHDPFAHGGLGGLDNDRPGQSSSLVSLNFMTRTLVPALEAWNDGDIESSMTTVALAMMAPDRTAAMPLRYREYVQLAATEDPAAPKDPSVVTLEGAARAAARRAIAEHPDTVTYFGRAARRLRGGMDAGSALGMPFTAQRFGPDPLVGQHLSPSLPDRVVPLSDADRLALARTFGATVPTDAFVTAGETWAEAAHGKVGEWMIVQPGITWQVSIRVPGVSGEISCGSTLVGASEMVDLPCGVTGEALVRGRIVDLNDIPLANAEVRGEAGPSVRPGPDGYFQMKWNVDRAMTVDVWACTDCAEGEVRGLVGARRSVSLLPGRTTDVGDIVLGPSAPTVGSQGEVAVRGGTFLPTISGFFIDAVDEGSWLESEGVSPGDALVRMGSAEAGRVGRDELFRVLGGGNASSFQEELPLWLRTAEGELYPVNLRAPVAPAKQP